jgi:hypothetical protein
MPLLSTSNCGVFHLIVLPGAPEERPICSGSCWTYAAFDGEAVAPVF